MDKAAELAILEKLLGPPAHQATAGEAPDFTLSTPGGVIGFEVTEFYASDSDGKLENSATYAMSLLEGTGRIHRRDEGAFDVSRVTVQGPDGTEFAIDRAIVRQTPPFENLVRRLMEIIASKEQKHSSYVATCDQVDLIVYDRSGHFVNDDPNKQLVGLCRSLPFSVFRYSPFREIFLISRTFSHDDIMVPLKSVVLASDVHAFPSLLKTPIVPGEAEPADVLPLLLAYLLELGHVSVLLADRDDDILSLMGGAWELNYGPENIAIRNWTLPHRAFKGRRLGDLESELSEAIFADARAVAAKRATLMACVPIHMPAAKPGSATATSIP